MTTTKIRMQSFEIARELAHSISSLQLTANQLVMDLLMHGCARPQICVCWLSDVLMKHKQLLR